MPGRRRRAEEWEGRGTHHPPPRLYPALQAGTAFYRHPAPARATSSFNGDQVSYLLNDLRQGANSKILLSLNLDDEKAGEVSDMWSRAALLFDLILDNKTPNTAANRATKSESVRVAAANYVAGYETYITVPEAKNYPNYLHEIKFHLHQYVAWVTTNLSEMSGQALEHLNKMAKQAKVLSNYKRVGSLVGGHKTAQKMGALGQVEKHCLVKHSLMYQMPSAKDKRKGVMSQMNE